MHMAGKRFQLCPMAVAKALPNANPQALLVCDNDGYTPLYHACASGDEIVPTYCRYLTKLATVLASNMPEVLAPTLRFPLLLPFSFGRTPPCHELLALLETRRRLSKYATRICPFCGNAEFPRTGPCMSPSTPSRSPPPYQYYPQTRDYVTTLVEACPQGASESCNGVTPLHTMQDRSW